MVAHNEIINQIKSLSDISTTEIKCKLGNLDRYKAYRTSPRGFLSAILRKTKRSCRKRHKEFEIDLVDLVEVWQKQQEKCAISKVPLSFKVGDPFSASLDRIDSARGYTCDNIRLVCTWVSHAKWDYPVDVFISWCKLVSKMAY